MNLLLLMTNVLCTAIYHIMLPSYQHTYRTSTVLLFSGCTDLPPSLTDHHQPQHLCCCYSPLLPPFSPSFLPSHNKWGSRLPQFPYHDSSSSSSSSNHPDKFNLFFLPAKSLGLKKKKRRKKKKSYDCTFYTITCHSQHTTFALQKNHQPSCRRNQWFPIIFFFLHFYP